MNSFLSPSKDSTAERDDYAGLRGIAVRTDIEPRRTNARVPTYMRLTRRGRWLRSAMRRSGLVRALVRVDVYLEPRDVWVGYFRGDVYHYVCPLPCVVVRVPRG